MFIECLKRVCSCSRLALSEKEFVGLLITLSFQHLEFEVVNKAIGTL